ncbi:hypothetical protein GE09DRAFT_1262623 [Coniochaeta sp. 2T2.1]|nr:hypothetical protein GE09DRAFT_1262623 [Coniochaeta sp. 2T2.1]
MKFTLNLGTLAVLALVQLVNCMTGDEFFPDNGQGWLSAGGCDPEGWWMKGTIWRAMCPDQVCGSMVESFLDLNECITNTNGNLYWNDAGYFGQSCSNCISRGSKFMVCDCQVEGTSGRKRAIINLNEGVMTNYWGYLSCFGKVDFGRGTHKWPCKPDDWTPWSPEALAHGKFTNHTVTKPVAARPAKTMFPQHGFLGLNATAARNSSVVTVTVVPTA